MLSRIARRLPGYALLQILMSETRVRPATARELASEHYRVRGRSLDVLDLGCGEGTSATWFAEMDSDVRWAGVDIDDSPEVAARRGDDARLSSFDGINLPYAAESFDMIYCHQVLEHVRFPHELLAEVRRALRPGGVFVGSVSYLEPYHSFSVFNFTPFGMAFSLDNAGLTTVLLHHSSDAFYKIMRQMLGGFSWLSCFSGVSIVYAAASVLGFLSGSSRRDINLMKIQYAGSFCFVAEKPAVSAA